MKNLKKILAIAIVGGLEIFSPGCAHLDFQILPGYRNYVDSSQTQDQKMLDHYRTYGGTSFLDIKVK